MRCFAKVMGFDKLSSKEASQNASINRSTCTCQYACRRRIGNERWGLYSDRNIYLFHSLPPIVSRSNALSSILHTT